MSNWDYAVKVPTDPWRSAMTVPRKLSLKGNTLVQTAIEKPGGFPEVSFTTSGGAIRIHETPDRYTEIGVRDGKIYVDTTHAWNEIEAPLVQEVPKPTSEVDFRVIVDRGSIEVFAAGSTVCITNLVLVDTALHYVETVGEVNNLKLQQLFREQQG
jgi:sucrose-6-phosphate hydrolase SacC (GH32 family)